MTKLYICLFWQKHPSRQAEFDAMGQGMHWRSAAVLLIAAILIPVLGMSGLMDDVADLGMRFLTGAEMEHAVHYFTWTNLKGAVISVAIGAAVYLLVVRTWLMRKEEYVDRWPSWLDLEERIYRPVIHGFYVICGAVCRLFGENLVIRVVAEYGIRAVAILTRALGDLPDALVALAGRTIFAPSAEMPSTQMSRSQAWRAGHHLDHINERHHKQSQLGRRFYQVSETLRDTTTRITGSLSFSLLMACMGVCLLMFYLLYHFAF